MDPYTRDIRRARERRQADQQNGRPGQRPHPARRREEQADGLVGGTGEAEPLDRLLRDQLTVVCGKDDDNDHHQREQRHEHLGSKSERPIEHLQVQETAEDCIRVAPTYPPDDISEHVNPEGWAASGR